jgi:hypothetical protein
MSKKRCENQIFLLLLDSPEIYQAYKKAADYLDEHELVICCLNIEMVNYCNINNLQYFLPEDYYSEQELLESKNLSEKVIKELVQNLNQYFHKNLPSEDGFLYDVGNYNFFRLYQYFDALHFRAFFLSKIIDKSKVNKIIVATSLLNSCENKKFPVTQYQNCYYDLLLNSINRQKIIPLEIKRSISRSNFSLRTKFRKLVGRLVRRFVPINKFINFYQNSIPFSFKNLVGLNNNATILLLGGAGPWKSIFSSKKFTDRVDVYMKIDGDLEETIPEELNQNWFRNWFGWEDNFCGFEISELGQFEMSRIRVLAERYKVNYRRTKEFLLNYKAILYCVAPYPNQEFLLSLAKHIGIPRICMQHGEMSLKKNDGLWDETSELLYSSHYFSYGDAVSEEKFQRAKKMGVPINAISIGSPVLDKLKILSKRSSYVLYASSKYHNYGGGFLPRYADLNIARCQKLLLEYFDNYLSSSPNIEVIWKQNQELTTELPQYTSNKVSVITHENSFVGLLPGASIVILDRPSTTSLEACMTDKPIFVLLADKNWLTLPWELLSKRACISYTPEDLVLSVDKYLKSGKYPADIYNKDFVMHYGVYKNDGQTIHRAVTEIRKLI